MEYEYILDDDPEWNSRMARRKHNEVNKDAKDVRMRDSALKKKGRIRIFEYSIRDLYLESTRSFRAMLKMARGSDADNHQPTHAFIIDESGNTRRKTFITVDPYLPNSQSYSE